jgi:hypothetical protein
MRRGRRWGRCCGPGAQAQTPSPTMWRYSIWRWRKFPPTTSRVSRSWRVLRRPAPRTASASRARPAASATLGLARAAYRELVWGLRDVSREVDGWRALADTIPNAELRADALEALACKRPMIDGAAMFWTLPQTRSPELLRLLVAYQVLADYLDCTSERAASHGVRNGLQLHRALVEAIDSSLPISDYYEFHPWCEDGGYAQALCSRSTMSPTRCCVTPG